MPTTAGRFRLQTPDGKIRRVKVIYMNNDLYAVVPTGRLFFSWAMLVADVEGEWLGAA